MNIRPSTRDDLPAMEELYARARTFMAEQGNPTQWGKRYPLAAQMEDVEEDIALGRSYVCTEGERIMAAFMFTIGPDPTYAHIEDGSWPDDRPYGVVHRIATGGERKGAGAFCLNWCLAQCENLRIDTHEENRPMRQLLDKLGFFYCGIIYVEDGSPRRAYCKRRPVLRTQRLMLRPVEMGDLQTMYRYTGDEENTRYMLFLPHRSEGEAEAALQSAVREWRKVRPTVYDFAVCLDGVHIGGASVQVEEDGEVGELGWIIAKEYWGQGYASESAEAVKEFALTSRKLKQVRAHCDTRNLPSARIMEKLGLVYRETCPRRYPDERGEAEEHFYTT